MTDPLHWHSRSPQQTISFGRALGRLLHSGDLIALTGPLGSGKTQLVKGIAAGLAVPDRDPVVSPTFVLVREYFGRLKLYHVDAYRLTHADQLLALGLDEMLTEPDAAVAVEWADRVAAALPSAAWWIELAHAGPSDRTLTARIPAATIRSQLARALP